MSKEHKSVFVTDLEIDIANFLTEVLFVQFFKSSNRPLPTGAFWKKEYTDVNPSFKWLSEKYNLEIQEVRKLLKVFSPSVISAAITKHKVTTLVYMKKEERKEMIYQLYLDQLKLVKQLDNRTVLETMEIKDFKEVPKFAPKKGKMAL